MKRNLEPRFFVGVDLGAGEACSGGFGKHTDIQAKQGSRILNKQGDTLNTRGSGRETMKAAPAQHLPWGSFCAFLYYVPRWPQGFIDLLYSVLDP